MLGAAIIDGAANFGVAYVVRSPCLPAHVPLGADSHHPDPGGRSCAMYRTVHAPGRITMWNIRENTIAGDCAVTVFIQVRPRSLSLAASFPGVLGADSKQVEPDRAS